MTDPSGSGQPNNHDESNSDTDETTTVANEEEVFPSPRATKILVTCAAIAGIAVLPLTIGLLVAAPGTIRAICFVFGIIAVVIIAVDLIFARQRRITMVALPMAAVFAGLTGAAAYAGWAGKPSQLSPNLTNAAPSKAHEDSQAPIEITPPSDPTHVGRCLTLNISGRVPDGEQLLVVNQIGDSSQRYFKPASMPGTDDNSWSISLTIGNQQMPKPQKVTIYAVLVTKWLADYLTTMQQYQNESNNYWASSRWPPSALIANQISVTRSQITGPKSCPP
jgi:hypothetical protein